CVLSFVPAKSSKPYISLQAILHACRVCFAERRLFTQERLSAAIGQLLEQPTLPTLFMRTVMQALALHPRLAGYVINVLVRLIRKQVWKSEKLWDGFIRCCVKTRPQSYQVLLQLPPERLEDVFRREPAMRTQVRRYVENFSSAQRIHISKSIVEVLERVPTPPPQPTKGATTANTGSKTEEALEISASPPPSPLSSGPGTPTRDEIPHQDLSAAALAVAVAMLGNNATSTQAGAVQPQAYSLMPRQAQPPSPSTFSPPGEASEHRSRSPFGNESYLANTTSSMDQERERRTQPSAEDDLEPPTLPPTRIFSTLSKLPDKSVHSDNSDDGTARLLELVDQTPLDWSTEDADDFILRDPKPDDSRQPKRPVDLEKLEADRRRLEEEASKFRKLRAERKQAQSSHDSPVPDPNADQE
ncbi:symplekin, partial [Clonorchis sinensis]